MNILSLDLSNGISGDMFLSALLDVGADEEQLRQVLASLPCHDEFELAVRPLTRGGLHGKQLSVIETHIHHHSHAHDHDAHSHTHRVGYSEFAQQINASGMSHSAKVRALRVLKALAEAEANVHDTTIEEVHFHEVGGIDTIVDICGAVIALELLGIEKIYASAVNVGGGTIHIAHGKMTVPAPAVAELLTGIPSYGDISERGELTTPTGAALLKGLGVLFQPFPLASLIRQGCGMGQRENGTANALRAQLYKTQNNSRDEKSDSVISADTEKPVVAIECNIDDMNGEELAFVCEQLRESAALEVYLTPIIMKKGRPAYLLSVLCYEEHVSTLENMIFDGTSTLGIRKTLCQRSVLERYMITVETQYGLIQVKCAQRDGTLMRYKPEFEDCQKAAKRYDVPLRAVMRAAEKAMQGRL